MPRQALARRWTRVRRARVLTGLAAGCAVVFLVLAFVLRQAAGSGIDLTVTQWIQQLDHPLFAQAMVAISAPGFAPFNLVILPVVALGFVVAGFRREALFLVATAGAGLISGLTKTLVARPRPDGEGVRVLGQLLDFSYPSGHVVGYVSFYGFLFFLTYVLFKRSLRRTVALAGLGLLVATVGLSRIYLGHHWLSDVLGGYALGTAYLVILVRLYRLTSPAVKPPNPASAGPLTASPSPSTHG